MSKLQPILNNHQAWNEETITTEKNLINCVEQYFPGNVKNPDRFYSSFK